MNKLSLRIALSLALNLLISTIVYGEAKYLGAATCSSSSCHGGVSAHKNSNVMQNEYTVWFKYEAHSQAWKALTTADSKKIAQHLGISDPEKDPLCLSCHATHVSAALQGEKFRISDGVSCESCHGAAENYIKSHTSRKNTHEENVKNGLIDLASLQTRANLCLSCHHGTSDRTVNHRLIGAGHPRLTFELDTFGILQPNHWQADSDYVERKGDYLPAKAWLVGQIVRSSKMLDKLSSQEQSAVGLMPELSLFTCYSCHHSLKQDQWKNSSYQGKPGELRLNLSSLQMLTLAFAEIDNNLTQQLSEQIKQMHGELYAGDIKVLAQKMKNTIDNEFLEVSEKIAYNNIFSRRLLKRISEFSAGNSNHSFETAEQCVMAISALISQIKAEDDYIKTQVDLLYKSLNDEENFNPAVFQKASQTFVKFVEKRFDE